MLCCCGDSIETKNIKMSIALLKKNCILNKSYFLFFGGCVSISRIIGFLASTVLAATSFQTKAANAVESFSSNASVAVTCKLNTPTNIAVTYDAFSSAETSSTNSALAEIECTSVRSTAPTQWVAVNFSEGLHPAPGSSCSAPLRQMGLNERLLSYRLVSGPKINRKDLKCDNINSFDLNTSTWVNYCKNSGGVHEDGSPYCIDMVDGVWVETPMSSKPNYTGNVKMSFNGSIIISKQQDVAEGTYSDTITVTVTF